MIDSAFDVNMSSLVPMSHLEAVTNTIIDWDRPGAAATYLAKGNTGRFLALLSCLVLSAFPFTFGKLPTKPPMSKNFY